MIHRHQTGRSSVPLACGLRQVTCRELQNKASCCWRVYRTGSGTASMSHSGRMLWSEVKTLCLMMSLLARTPRISDAIADLFAVDPSTVSPVRTVTKLETGMGRERMNRAPFSLTRQRAATKARRSLTESPSIVKYWMWWYERRRSLGMLLPPTGLMTAPSVKCPEPSRKATTFRRRSKGSCVSQSRAR